MSLDPIPLIRASQVRPFLTCIDHIGAPREYYLRQAKLPLLAYDDPEAVLPELFLWRLTEQFVHKEGIDDFGLLAATLTPLWKSEPELTGLLQSLPTLWIALKTFFRLAKQFSSLVRFQIVREGDVALLQFIHAPGLPAEDQGELYDVKILPSRR